MGWIKLWEKNIFWLNKTIILNKKNNIVCTTFFFQVVTYLIRYYYYFIYEWLDTTLRKIMDSKTEDFEKYPTKDAGSSTLEESADEMHDRVICCHCGGRPCFWIQYKEEVMTKIYITSK